MEKTLQAAGEMLTNIVSYSDFSKMDVTGGPLVDGAVDGCEPAEPRGEPALKVPMCGPITTGPL